MNIFQTKWKKKTEADSSQLNAGAELLSRFQADWENLHGNSVHSSNSAKELSKLLERSAVEWKRTDATFNQLHIHLQTLPSLVDEIDKVTSAVGKLEASVEEVTCAIDYYEKICKEYKLCKQRQLALQEVHELRIAKRQELEKMKGALASKHALRLSEIQSKQAMLTQERQETLQRALESEVHCEIFD